MNNITQLEKQTTMNQHRKSQRSTGEELKITYEPLMRTPKKLKKSNVKRMASIYNSKVKQLIKNDIDNGDYLRETEPKNLTVNTILGLKNHPRTKSGAQMQQMSACFKAKDSLSKLTAKDNNNTTKSDLEKEANTDYANNFIEEDIENAKLAYRTSRNKCSSNPEISQTNTFKELECADSIFEIFLPVPALINCHTASTSSNSVKLSFSENSDSELSSYYNNSSDKLQSENNKNENSDKEFNFDIPPPLSQRKKKFHKNCALKKNLYLKDCQALSSTDSTEDEVKPQLPSTPLKSNFGECYQTLKRQVKSKPAIKLSCSPKGIDFEHYQSGKAANSPLDLVGQVYKNYKMDNFEELKKLIKFFDIPTTKSSTNCFTNREFATKSNKVDYGLSLPPQQLLLNNQIKDISKSGKSLENTFEFPKPINEQCQPSSTCTNSAKQQQQQLLSPIEKQMKHLRKSLNDFELSTKILTMPMIPEDETLEYHLRNLSLYNTLSPQQQDVANAFSFPISLEKISKFWIKCDNFSISLDIFYTDNERLCLLYQNFTQNSCNTKDLYFGIDDYKFMLDTSNDHKNISSHILAVKGQSHYWFSTGELTIPFSGKYLSPQKIQSMFQFIRGSVETTSVLRFGVDDIEFSNTCSLLYAKSMERELLPVSSNSLKELSNFEWPHSKAVIVINLDESEGKKEAKDVEQIAEKVFEVTEHGPSHSNNFCDNSSLDTENLTEHRKSATYQRLESFCNTLDKLFENNINEKLDHNNLKIEAYYIPKILTDLQNQQLYRKQDYSCASHNVDVLENLQGTPEYFNKLKSTVSDISKIVKRNTFKELSFQQLESYMLLLSHYADICLNICQNHTENVTDVLKED